MKKGKSDKCLTVVPLNLPVDAIGTPRPESVLSGTHCIRGILGRKVGRNKQAVLPSALGDWRDTFRTLFQHPSFRQWLLPSNFFMSTSVKFDSLNCEAGITTDCRKFTRACVASGVDWVCKF